MRQKVELEEVKQYFPSRHNGRVSCGVAEHATVMINDECGTEEEAGLPGAADLQYYCIRQGLS